MWLLLPLLAYSLIFLSVRHIYSYWRRKGFPSECASLSWHFLIEVYRREFRHVDAICDAYQKGRDRLFGIYCFFRPVLLIRNLELARSILEQSSGHFSESKWDYVKGFRRFNLLEKLTPIFGSSRLPMIFNNAQHVANHMMQHLVETSGEQGQLEIDMQHLFRIYAVNIIGNLVYGLDVNNFEQSDHILNSFVDHSTVQSFTLQHVPQKSSVTYRLLDIIKRNVLSREEGGFARKDMLQLLVLFRNGNDLSGDSWLVKQATEDEKLISIPRLAKVAEDFLHSALDSMASALTFTLYEIAQQPLIVEKLQEEIKELNLINGQLKFEQLEDLKYMDMCLKETLRMYPPIPIIERVCRKTYKLPNTKFSIEEGTTLMVPLLAIQRDKKHFGEPLTYKPLRFLHDKSEKANEQCRSALVGFGIGSAQCVAQNFAKMVIKLALVKLLHNYHLELDASSYVEISHLPAPFITSRHGLKVQLKAREILTLSNYRKGSL